MLARTRAVEEKTSKTKVYSTRDSIKSFHKLNHQFELTRPFKIEIKLIVFNRVRPITGFHYSKQRYQAIKKTRNVIKH